MLRTVLTLATAEKQPVLNSIVLVGIEVGY